MVNTVNDFWQMAWQEESPAIVMITKLKEKNEVSAPSPRASSHRGRCGGRLSSRGSFCLQKCVLYWPEKRGIYGKVEVLVGGVRECEHYTTRSLTLKVACSHTHTHAYNTCTTSL